MIDLGTLGGRDSTAYGINSYGQVVGMSQAPGNFPFHAFLYGDGLMLDLNDQLPAGSGWQLAYAFGINDAGQISGLGEINGEQHGFLLTPNSAAPSDRPAKLTSAARLALIATHTDWAGREVPILTTRVRSCGDPRFDSRQLLPTDDVSIEHRGSLSTSSPGMEIGRSCRHASDMRALESFIGECLQISPNWD